MNELLGCQGARFSWHQAQLRFERYALALGCDFLGSDCAGPITPVLTTQDARWTCFPAFCPLIYSCPVQPSGGMSPKLSSDQVLCAHRSFVASHGPREKVQAPSFGSRLPWFCLLLFLPSPCSNYIGSSVETSLSLPGSRLYPSRSLPISFLFICAYSSFEATGVAFV